MSVIMAARNVGDFIEEAITSVRQQSLSDLELLVVDDGSTDDTVAHVQRLVEQDSRVRLLRGPGAGPAAARNIAFAEARGHWLAVVDADDLLLADRLERLVGLGEELDVELVADNLTAFYDDGTREHLWLAGPHWGSPRDITLDRLLASGTDGEAQQQLGYLKPLFRRSWLQENALSYNEDLRIGEDYDLVARAVARGGRYHYVPAAGYRYRRHAASTSNRVEPAQLAAMLAAFRGLSETLPLSVRPVLEARIVNLEFDLLFTRQVEAIKRGRVQHLGEALMVRETRSRLVRAAREGIGRRLARLG